MAGQTVLNAVLVPVSASGDVCFRTDGTTHVLADVNGWFDDTGGFVPATASRVFDTHMPE